VEIFLLLLLLLLSVSKNFFSLPLLAKVVVVQRQHNR